MLHNQSRKIYQHLYFSDLWKNMNRIIPNSRIKANILRFCDVVGQDDGMVAAHYFKDINLLAQDINNIELITNPVHSDGPGCEGPRQSQSGLNRTV